MMDSYSGIEDDLFFDSRDEVSSVSDFVGYANYDCALGYEFWRKTPDSVAKRRRKFLKWMDLVSDCSGTSGGEEDSWHGEAKLDFHRLRDDGETVLANIDSESEYVSSDSLHSFRSCDAEDLTEDGSAEENLMWRIKNLDDGTEFILDELADNGTFSTFCQVGSREVLSIEEFQKTLGSSNLVQRLMRKNSEEYTIKEYNIMADAKKKSKDNWLRKFGSLTRMADKAKRFLDKQNEISPIKKSSARRVRVHVFKKRSKELSSLYSGQEFSAHEGSILTMKFSPDGQYLASAGKDGIIRVWKVLENDILDKCDIQDADPSGLYFTMNNFAKLVPSSISNERIAKTKILRKSNNSACVIVPQKVFQLLEKPLHEFHGHEGEVLALSWSKNGHLLSSSVDKTARLWRLEHDNCIGVFLHNNYVTCVEFNPVDDNYFISGSIDGKIRIWEVQGCRVIDWIDIREIITAVCYSPDGQGGIVGSVDGNCRFYDVIDARLELGTQICLTKKKLSGNRVTGFQFCPLDASKVMVTTADSQIRILRGSDVVAKFKGGNRGSGIGRSHATFTSDGEHVVSTSEDSKVHVWDYYNDLEKNSSRPKNLGSHENFLSHNASVAIPWCGFKNKLGALPGSILGEGVFDEKILQKLPASFPDCLSMSLGFFLDALYKASATWPEEKLPKSKPVGLKPSLRRSEFNFLKNAWLSALNTPHLWGQVIVTAGWDGCIRTFLNYGLPIRC